MVELADVHKYSISKFRTHTNHLPITRSRLTDYITDVTRPLCPTGDTGDEWHYLFHCSFFERKRGKFIPSNVLTQQPNFIPLSTVFQGYSIINMARFLKKNGMSKFKFSGIQKKSKKNRSP